jgi:hypothetical protein
MSVSLVLRLTAPVRITASKTVPSGLYRASPPKPLRVRLHCAAFYQVIFAFATAAIALGWLLS